MKIDHETFEEWAAHPITEALFAICKMGEEQAIAQWMAASIEGGVSDPKMLVEVRARVSALREIRGMTAEKMQEAFDG